MAALFTGTIVGRFLLDKKNIQSFLLTIDGPDPYLRLLSTWALRQAAPSFHQQILDEMLRVDFRRLGEHTRKMVFMVVARLTNVSHGSLWKFLQDCPWPTDVVLPDEFRRICSTLAEGNEEATRRWLMTEAAGSRNMRFRQIMNGIIGLVFRNIRCFTGEDLHSLYEMARTDDAVFLQFADVTGLLVNVDISLSADVFRDLLRSKNQNVRTAAMHSLRLSVNDNLRFTLDQGETVLSLSGKTDRYGLLHCFLHVLREYKGSEASLLIERLDDWFNDYYLSSLSDETAIIELLTLLKVYGKDFPDTVLRIARRCPNTSQGLCGALSAVYSNVAPSLNNFKVLSFLLGELMGIARFHQRHIRNALRSTIPLLVRKMGHDEVFQTFFTRRKEIESPAALERIVRALMSVPEWSHEETLKLLDDPDLPMQVRSVLISKAASQQ